MEEWNIAPPFLTSALDEASRPGPLTPEKIVPDTHWIGGRVGPAAGLDAVEKRNFAMLGIESGPSNP
jgi:hypothetical protein